MASRKKFRIWTNNAESEEEQEELLMFGYSCKLFRDDEKACYIDEEKHLIPWMGDSSLMIDRYDGRGHLHDLKPYEAGKSFEISEEDQLMEKMCDEERYSALTQNLEDEELYHEEELKRLRAALADDGTYNQVQFAYSDEVELKDSKENNSASNSEKIDLDLGKSKFVPPTELNVPEGLEVPLTAKVNTIIEKTALFVCRHGAQMEIVIKTKQANNPQFGFLSFDHSLNPYYKIMVQAIKSGKYIPKTQAEESSSEEDDDSDGEHYLHPSLLSGSQSKAPEVFSVPKLSYIKTGDDRYSLLVNQLKDKVYADIAENQRSSPKPADDKPAETVVNVDPGIPPPPGLEPVTLPPQGVNNQCNAPGEELGPIVVPPPEIISIVQKLAVYVAKNGEDFESVVKARGQDPRFEFLNNDHIYYTYYRQQLKIMQKEYAPITKNNGDDDGSKCGVVSFSIKAKENAEKKSLSNTGVGDQPQDGAKEEGPQNVEESADAIRIRAELHEARLAEEKIRDRLAAAARERLAKVSKEKQLQMERKRKAAMFLSMLQKGKEESGSSNIIGPRLPTQAELENLTNGDGAKSLPPVIFEVESPPKKNHSSPNNNAETIIYINEIVSTKSPEPSPKERSNSKEPVKKSSSSRKKSRSRSRSRSRRRHRSRSTSSERRFRKRNRSRERKRRRHRSSSSPESKSQKYSKRKTSRTPPASYMRVRNSSTSPRRTRSRSKSRNRHSRRSRSHSRH